MENPSKMGDLGVPLIFGNTLMDIYVVGRAPTAEPNLFAKNGHVKMQEPA